MLEQIESGTDFFGVESLIPAFHARMASLRDHLPEQATFVVVEPHRLYDTLRDLHHDGETAYQSASPSTSSRFHRRNFIYSQRSCDSCFVD